METNYPLDPPAPGPDPAFLAADLDRDGTVDLVLLDLDRDGEVDLILIQEEEEEDEDLPDAFYIVGEVETAEADDGDEETEATEEDARSGVAVTEPVVEAVSDAGSDSGTDTGTEAKAEVAAEETGEDENAPKAEAPAEAAAEPPQPVDTDQDGLTDEQESQLGTDALREDTDGDGIKDGAEDADKDGWYDVGWESDPLSKDTDRDGVSDGVEDSDKDGRRGVGETDARDADSDLDGVKDGQEDRDSDGAYEPDQGETNALDGKSVNEADRDNKYDSTGAANYTSEDLEGERQISHPEDRSPGALEAAEDPAGDDLADDDLDVGGAAAAPAEVDDTDVSLDAEEDLD
jgi:hypothetical protein